MSHKAYYRNLTTFNGIEADALWKLIGIYLQLVDADTFERVIFKDFKDKFYPVDDPFPKGYHH